MKGSQDTLWRVTWSIARWSNDMRALESVGCNTRRWLGGPAPLRNNKEEGRMEYTYGR